MSERWTCVMTKGLTFAHKPEGNELGVAQVDNLCGKTLSTRNEGERRVTHFCSDKLDPWRKKTVHERW